MATACIAAIDQGTSSSRVLLIASSGRMVSSHQMEHSQHYPTPGQVEHDPLEIWKNVKICLSEAIRKSPIEVEIVAIGITNQRETTVVWDKESGTPYHNAIVWNDTRTAKVCEQLIARFGSKDYFREKTGLPIASYFSASKLLHLLDTVPNIRTDAAEGKALFGTIDSWLMWKLTNGAVHATDVSNAARTMLMNLRTLDWDDAILQDLGIPKSMLPTIRPSSYSFGLVDSSDQKMTEHPTDSQLVNHYGDLHGVPVHGVLGDQNAALFGQACFHKGDAKCTYGTGAFLLMNTGQEIVPSSHGLLTTVAYQLAENVHRVQTDHHPADPGDARALHGQPVYALEGSVAYSGSVIQWLRDNLQLIKAASETESLAGSVPDSGGVYFVPAFAGLYAPYWREDARGVIAGLTAFNTKAHIVRAALEASAYQTIEILDAMHADAPGLNLKNLRVDGGLSANALIMQFQSDLLNVPLVRPKITETTAMGAAFVAGLGVGLWKNFDELQACWHLDREWKPKIKDQQRQKLIYGWQKALARSMYWRDAAPISAEGQQLSNASHNGPQDPYVEHLISIRNAARPLVDFPAAGPTAPPRIAMQSPTGASSAATDAAMLAGVTRRGKLKMSTAMLGLGIVIGSALTSFM